MSLFDTIPADWWDQLKAAYPQRAGHQGWVAVRMLVPRRMTEGYTWERILAGTKAFAVHAQKTNQAGTAFIPMAQTFYGPNAYFEEYADMDTRSPAQIASALRMGAALKRAIGLGFRLPVGNETAEQYESCLRDHERAQGSGLGQPKFQVIK